MAAIVVTAVAILAIIGLIGPVVWTLTIGVFTAVGLVRWAARESAMRNADSPDE
jgi:hypothetical protein